jgi:hypothetical protein
MCRAKNEELCPNKNQVLARWKEHFEEHLNEGSESEQPTRPVDLRDDGVDIDLPSCEEIEGALKYLKNNKVAGADSIAAELLKNGEPNLVDALHAVIQHYRKAGPRGYCVQCTRRAINSIVLPLERDIQSLHQNSMRPPFTPRSELPGWVPIG